MTVEYVGRRIYRQSALPTPQEEDSSCDSLLFFFKNVLAVDSTEHHVVDARIPFSLCFCLGILFDIGYRLQR